MSVNGDYPFLSNVHKCFMALSTRGNVSFDGNLPQQEGPDSLERTGSLQNDAVGEMLVERLDERGDLVLAQALEPAILGDADLGHELLGLDLAPARERLDELGNLDLAHDRVVALRERLLGRDLAGLDLCAELAASLAGLGGLLECFSALLFSHLR